MRSAIVGGLFSILLVSNAAHATPTNIAFNDTVTSNSENNAYGYTFVGSAVTDGRTNDTKSDGIFSFWLAQDRVTSAYVTIDLGATYDITGLTVEDTHNQGYFDRGTNAFSVGFGSTAANSESAAIGSSATSGAFTVAEWKNLTDKDIAATGTGRYVTFQALSAYGNSLYDTTGEGNANPSTLSVGLNEIQVFGKLASIEPPAVVGVPEPISMTLLGSGLLGLVALRRRSL